MGDAALRDLRQRLSEQLDRVERGELAAPRITPGSGEIVDIERRWTANGRVLEALADDRGD